MSYPAVLIHNADYFVLKVSSCKTHHLQLIERQRVQYYGGRNQELWRGDRLIGLRDWVPFGPDTKRDGEYCMFRARCKKKWAGPVTL